MSKKLQILSFSETAKFLFSYNYVENINFRKAFFKIT